MLQNLFTVCLILTGLVVSNNVHAQDIDKYFRSVEFSYTDVSGIGHEQGCTRRDPSDVIKVGDTWYVYYTKIYGRSPGYWGTLWYATSPDEGYTWKEEGEILGLGKKGMFDSQATFTPNILYANGKYYLYYTGVKPTPGNENGEFENNSTTDITAIGVAALASLSSTFEYAPDGVDFLSNKLGVKVENRPIRPIAPGVFRQDLTDPAVKGEGLKWGISMIHNGDEAYLVRYELVSK